MNQETIEKIMINNVEFVRADQVAKAPLVVDGLKYAIVRSREQGVMCGYVKSIDGRAVTLLAARQIWRYDSTFVLVDIADHGMRDSTKAMLSCPAPDEVVMLEACGVIYCSREAAEQLRGIPAVKK